MALMTTLYVLSSASASGVAVFVPTTSFRVLVVGRCHELEHAAIDGKEGRIGASQVPANRVPLGVGPDVGGYGRRIRRAVFIDLGVPYRSHRRATSTSSSVITGARRRR